MPLSARERRALAASGNRLKANVIIRADELSEATVAHVRAPLLKPRKATLCTLVEEPKQPLAILDSTVVVPIRGAGLATVALE